MRIEDMIIVSDLDGTLVPGNRVISQKNIDAIHRFRMLGGDFTVATGRSPRAAKSVLQTIGVDTPVITNNGAVIYDPKAEKPLWAKLLAPSFRDLIHETKAAFPEVGIEVITSTDDYFHVADNYRMRDNVTIMDIVDTSMLPIVREEQLPENSCKVLFTIEPANFEQFTSYIQEKRYNDFEFVRSAADCLEMMACGISKGYPFTELLGFYKKERIASIAVGDYYNDVELLEAAGIAVAPANALEEIKERANLVVSACEDDGIADLIEYLIAHYDHK